MGVLYTVVPLDDEVKPWLREMGVTISESHEPSRNPTPLELRKLPKILNDLKVSVYSPPGHAWQIMFEGLRDPENEPWTLLNVSDFSGNEATPHSIWFEKGWPSLILRVVHILSAHCGPLVIIPDTGCKPIVVTDSESVEALLASWEHAH